MVCSQTIYQKSLLFFEIFGPVQMDHLCQELVEHYHQNLSHQGQANEKLVKPKSEQIDKISAMIRLADALCKHRLGLVDD